MLKPLGDRVVLKVEEKEQTVGGFVIAGGSSDPQWRVGSTKCQSR